MEETQEIQDTKPSRKREWAVKATATAAPIVLAVGANVLSAYLSQKVTNKMTVKADTK
jgi:hypothetical protein